jgi:hypothetical protein
VLNCSCNLLTQLIELIEKSNRSIHVGALNPGSSLATPYIPARRPRISRTISAKHLAQTGLGTRFQ